jgi:hypothetical protein
MVNGFGFLRLYGIHPRDNGVAPSRHSFCFSIVLLLLARSFLYALSFFLADFFESLALGLRKRIEGFFHLRWRAVSQKRMLETRLALASNTNLQPSP